jgi:hypothetical protein
MNLFKIFSFILSPVTFAIITGILLFKNYYIKSIHFIAIVFAGLFITMINSIVIIVRISKKGKI